MVMVKKRGKLADSVYIPAAYWKRSLAFLIDFLIIDLIILTPFRSIFKTFLENGNPATILQTNPEILTQVTWILVIISFLVVAYFSILEFKLRQTIGMMIFNLWLYSDNKKLSMFHIIISNLTFIPIFPFIILWIIDPIYMLFSQSRQRLMQKFVDIYIIEEKDFNTVLSK